MRVLQLWHRHSAAIIESYWKAALDTKVHCDASESFTPAAGRTVSSEPEGRSSTVQAVHDKTCYTPAGPKGARCSRAGPLPLASWLSGRLEFEFKRKPVIFFFKHGAWKGSEFENQVTLAALHMGKRAGHRDKNALASEGHSIVESRLKQDLSAVFSIPTLPADTPEAAQPPTMRIPLYAYQRRSLHRM